MEGANKLFFNKGKIYACDQIIDYIVKHEEAIKKVNASPFVFSLVMEIQRIKAIDGRGE